MALNNLKEWKANISSAAVQSNYKTSDTTSKTIAGADFLSSETIVICSGPPEYSSGDLNSKLIPIGLVQNVQVQQNKQITQLFEIGSRKPFFIPGRTIVSMSISRILFDGPSLMYSLYIQGMDGAAPTGVELSQGNGTNGQASDQPTTPFTLDAAGLDFGSSEGGDESPGLFFINLASSFFNKPLGLAFVMLDNEEQPYGGFYAQNVYIQSHVFQAASQQTILVENVNLRCTDIVPIDVEDVG